MRALIIEDEKAAVRNLKAAIDELGRDIEVIGQLDSIAASIEWLREQPAPDLLFLDIHLADGSAFEIFEHVDITCPIIFTTAYDEYALRAFKVNSVDYLLKPIDADDLRQALDKLERLGGQKPTAQPDDNYRAILRALGGERNYKSHFLIPAKGDRLIPIETETILYFHIANGQVKAVDDTGREHLFPQTLDELADGGRSARRASGSTGACPSPSVSRRPSGSSSARPGRRNSRRGFRGSDHTSPGVPPSPPGSGVSPPSSGVGSAGVPVEWVLSISCCTR